MRLLEYNATQFLKNITSSEKKENIEKGYNFGINEFFSLEFWIERNSKYNYIDFVHSVYELNFKTYNIDIIELIENLAHFLCGYDLQVKDRNIAMNEPSEKQHSYFQNQKINIDVRVTNAMLSEKIDLIKEILNL